MNMPPHHPTFIGTQNETPHDKVTSLYRPGVGIMIINHDKKVWMGRRSDASHYPDSSILTQMPQGGLDTGETPIQAAWREMYEETGLTDKHVRLIHEYPDWLAYDFPEYVLKKFPTRKFIGQRQKWFLFLLTGNDSDFNLHTYKYDEFSSFQWMDLEQVPSHVVDFKQGIYQQVCTYFKPIIDAL